MILILILILLIFLVCLSLAISGLLLYSLADPPRAYIEAMEDGRFRCGFCQVSFGRLETGVRHVKGHLNTAYKIILMLDVSCLLLFCLVMHYKHLSSLY